jgi:hypothetical protein
MTISSSSQPVQRLVNPERQYEIAIVQANPAQFSARRKARHHVEDQAFLLSRTKEAWQ